MKRDGWRWDCVKEHEDVIASHVFDLNQVGIDFGGFLGPIGGHTTIIDIRLDNSLDDVLDDSLDYIYTSHTLEHIEPLESILRKMYVKLKKGANIIIHVPAYTMTKWRPENDPDHKHALSIDGHDTDLKKLLLDVGFKIITATYCYKHCIFIYGEK